MFPFFFSPIFPSLGPSIHRGPTWQVDVQWDPGDILQTLPAAEHGHGGLHGQPQWVGAPPITALPTLPTAVRHQPGDVTRHLSFSSRSVGHVQLSRPGDGQEGDLQSSSGGSGHQLRPSAGQVGSRNPPRHVNKGFVFFVIPSRLSLTSARCVSGPVCSRSFEVPLSGSVECECALTLTDLT